MISIILCTYNRAQILHRCLDSLRRQESVHGPLEIVVVDNNSNDGTDAVVRGFAEADPRFRYVFEPRQGLTIARNRGLREAAFDICAFTDDDAVAEPDWADKIVRGFAELGPDTAVLGGEIAPVWGSPRPDWLTDRLLRPLSAGLGWGGEARHLGPDEWLCEVNSAYRKAPLLQVGGFPEQLGRVGDNLLSGENAVNLLIQAKGFKVFFDPNLQVYHHIPGDRLTKAWFRRRFFWQGITTSRLHAYLRLHGEVPSPWPDYGLPKNLDDWADIFDDSADGALEADLALTARLGYMVAEQGLLSGR